MGLSKYQKINHFPCAYEMTRKNCLGVHVWKMHERFSKDEFHFIPQTFSLPEQMTEFRVAFNKGKKEGTRDMWIVKPNTLSRGRGIYLIDELSDLKEDEECAVGEYIDNPFLINGLKFDL